MRAIIDYSRASRFASRSRNIHVVMIFSREQIGTNGGTISSAVQKYLFYFLVTSSR